MHSCSVIRTRVCFGISMKSQRPRNLRRKRADRDRRTSRQKPPQRERSKAQHDGEADTKGGLASVTCKDQGPAFLPQGAPLHRISENGEPTRGGGPAELGVVREESGRENSLEGELVLYVVKMKNHYLSSNRDWPDKMTLSEGCSNT